MIDPEVTKYNQIVLGNVRMDRLSVAQELGEIAYVEETDLIYMLGGKVTGRAIEIVVRATEDPTNPVSAVTVREGWRYQKRLEKAREAADFIVNKLTHPTEN